MRCNDLSANAPRFCCQSGSELKPVYHTKILKDGNLELVVTGYENIQDKIDAERLGVELSTLIARYENGDLLALNTRSGFYADATKFPASLIDAMNIVQDAQTEFDKLPVDLKKSYGSDWRKWLADFGSVEWLKSMKLYKEEEKESEVKNDAE